MDGAPIEPTPSNEPPRPGRSRGAIVAACIAPAVIIATIAYFVLQPKADSRSATVSAPATPTTVRTTTTRAPSTSAPTTAAPTSSSATTDRPTTTNTTTTAQAPNTDEESDGDTATTPAATPTVAGNQVSRVATAIDGVSSIDVYQSADGERLTLPGSDGPLSIANPSEDGVPAVFLIKGTAAANPADTWLEVSLPVRPNGTRGWIRASSVAITEHRFRIVVELDAHRLTLFNDGQVAESFPIGVGTSDTPTPGGEFYIKELLQPPDPGGPYGTYAYGLSGYSDVLQSFNGGSGVVGIHGTNDDSTVGRDVSHGCIRLHNSDIEKLVGILPLGVPVEIRA